MTTAAVRFAVSGRDVEPFFVALRGMRRYARRMNSLTLKAQELPFDHPDSTNMFQPTPEKPFVATPAAIDMYQQETIIECLRILQQKAVEHGGLDYLQVCVV